MIKKSIKKLLKYFINLLVKINFITILAELISEVLSSKTIKVNHNGTNLKFYTINYLTRWRVQTFNSKEPETLKWIDDFESEKCLFWDIGANIGLYTCYAAKRKNCKVYGNI